MFLILVELFTQSILFYLFVYMVFSTDIYIIKFFYTKIINMLNIDFSQFITRNNYKSVL